MFSFCIQSNFPESKKPLSPINEYGTKDSFRGTTLISRAKRLSLILSYHPAVTRRKRLNLLGRSLSDSCSGMFFLRESVPRFHRRRLSVTSKTGLLFPSSHLFSYLFSCILPDPLRFVNKPAKISAILFGIGINVYSDGRHH
jgi:hypothetical protein